MQVKLFSEIKQKFPNRKNNFNTYCCCPVSGPPKVFDIKWLRKISFIDVVLEFTLSSLFPCKKPVLFVPIFTWHAAQQTMAAPLYRFLYVFAFFKAQYVMCEHKKWSWMSNKKYKKCFRIPICPCCNCTRPTDDGTKIQSVGKCYLGTDKVLGQIHQNKRTEMYLI